MIADHPLNIKYADYKDTINLYFEDGSAIVLSKLSIMYVTPQYDPYAQVFDIEVICTRFRVVFKTVDKDLVKLLVKNWC